MLQKLLNIGANSLKRRNMPVIFGKVVTRLKERSISAAANDSAKAGINAQLRQRAGRAKY